MLSNEKIQRLQQNLPQGFISKRPDGMNYVEGHYVISTANAVFGFDGWAYTLNDLSYINSKGKNGIFQAIVTVQVNADGHTVARTDVGYGIPTGETAQAYENAGKTAVTDAMKRAFRTFGNLFGNSLYAGESSVQAPASDVERELVSPKPVPSLEASSPANTMPATLPADNTQPAAAIVECQECGSQVKASRNYSVPQIVAFCKRTYGGRVLCYDCQQLHSKQSAA